MRWKENKTKQTKINARTKDTIDTSPTFRRGEQEVRGGNFKSTLCVHVFEPVFFKKIICSLK
jgi:hypothetical protein